MISFEREAIYAITVNAKLLQDNFQRNEAFKSASDIW